MKELKTHQFIDKIKELEKVIEFLEDEKRNWAAAKFNKSLVLREFNDSIDCIDQSGYTGKVDLIDMMGNELTIVNAARVSFYKNKKVFEKTDAGLVKYLLKNNHWSPFEHNTMTFRIETPLFVRSQHHRHKSWSFSEVSRRYTEYRIKFYTPEMFRTQNKVNKQASNLEWINPCLEPEDTQIGMFNFNPEDDETFATMVKDFTKLAKYMYDLMLERNICREQARGVLPQFLFTEYYATCSLRSLIHYLALRDDSHSQLEHQHIAKSMVQLVSPYFENTFKAYKEVRGIE